VLDRRDAARRNGGLTGLAPALVASVGREPCRGMRNDGRDHNPLTALVPPARAR